MRSLLELHELCERTGVTARTVRYYVQQGLLRSPGQTGPGAKYDQGHLSRLLLIRRLQQHHLPLAEIRKRLEGLDDAAVQSLLERPQEGSAVTDYVRQVLGSGESGSAPTSRRPVPPPAPPRAHGHAVERSQWERIAISPDVEIHVRRPLSRDDNRRVERLVEEAQRFMNGSAAGK